MSDLSEFVVLSDTTLTTDSRRVAKHFKKRHDNVLRAIDGLDCSEEYRLLNFEEVFEEYENGNGAKQKSRVIRMTKDGWVFLVMGFKGGEAPRIKEAYIKAFNAMAEQLQRLGDARYHSLWSQRLELEKRDATSFMFASFGGKCMKARQREKPLLENERAILAAEMEPNLFLVKS